MGPQHAESETGDWHRMKDFDVSVAEKVTQSNNVGIARSRHAVVSTIKCTTER